LKIKINITVATSVNGKGGISTVLTGYQNSNFFSKTDTHLIASHKSGKFGRLSLMYNFFISIIKLLVLFTIFKVSVVHVHMASRGSYSRKSLIARLAKKLGASIIIHLHGAEFKVFYGEESSGKKQEYIRNTFNMADQIIVLSSQWQQWMNTIVTDTSKVCVVYNAVPEIKLPKKTEIKEVVLFLGRLGKRKGVDDLIQAFSIINKKYPNAELHLGGDGDLPFYQKLIDDLKLTNQVKLLGWVAGDEKNQCFANATIYCLPSYNEGFPMGVLEAMSSNVAVVASKAGGIPDAITDKQEGLLIDAGDVPALSGALSSLLADATLRQQYSQAALVKYRENFSPQVINAQLLSIYSELTD